MMLVICFSHYATQRFQLQLIKLVAWQHAQMYRHKY